MSLEILVARIEERIKSMDEKLDDKLEAIHDQTKKTNGRVLSLEDWRVAHNLQEAKNYQSVIVWIRVYGIAILFLLAIAAPKVAEMIKGFI